MLAKKMIAILAVTAVVVLGIGVAAMSAGQIVTGQRDMMDRNGCPGSGMMSGSDCPMNGGTGGGQNCSMDSQDCPHHDDGATQNCTSHRP